MTSVANEYAGYCTTAEEYAEQRYEGGHTLYGPATQPFLAAHAARLAAETVRAGLVSDLVPDRRFDLRHHRYLPGPAGPPVDRATDGPATFRDATGTTDPVWEQRWWDVVPGALGLARAARPGRDAGRRQRSLAAGRDAQAPRRRPRLRRGGHPPGRRRPWQPLRGALVGPRLPGRTTAPLRARRQRRPTRAGRRPVRLRSAGRGQGRL